MTAGDVMDKAASLLNDSGKDMWTYEKLLPYMQMAYGDFVLRLVANGVAIIKSIVTNLDVAAGVFLLSPPADCADPMMLEERLYGSSDDYEEMEKVDKLTQRNTGTKLLEYTWEGEQFHFVGATTRRQIRLTYKKLLTEVSSSASTIPVEEAKQALAEVCAAYAATFGNNNPTRGKFLQAAGTQHMDMVIAELVKQNQDMPIRRLPFRG